MFRWPANADNRSVVGRRRLDEAIATLEKKPLLRS
jgi:hypothetical protein